MGKTKGIVVVVEETKGIVAVMEGMDSKGITSSLGTSLRSVADLVGPERMLGKV